MIYRILYSASVAIWAYWLAKDAAADADWKVIALDAFMFGTMLLFLVSPDKKQDAKA